jgi:hypothetical protein
LSVTVTGIRALSQRSRIVSEGAKMKRHIPELLIATMLMLFSTALAAAEDIERLTGKDSGRPRAFTVDGPWMMDWSTRSEFPMLASFEMRLYDGESGNYIGMIAELKGTGSGLKLFEEAGTFQIVIVATSSEWDISIREVSREQAAVMKRRAEGAPSMLDSARRAGRFLPEDSFESWRPEGNDTLLLFSNGYPGWRVSFSPSCPGLESATSLSFVMTSGDGMGQYDSILLEDGARCYFASVTPSGLH